MTEGLSRAAVSAGGSEVCTLFKLDGAGSVNTVWEESA
jgi:hypothetical protein